MTTADELRNRAAFFRNPDYVKHGFPGHLIEPLAAELESAAEELERLTARNKVLEDVLTYAKQHIKAGQSGGVSRDEWNTWRILKDAIAAADKEVETDE